MGGRVQFSYRETANSCEYVFGVRCEECSLLCHAVDRLSYKENKNNRKHPSTSVPSFPHIPALPSRSVAPVPGRDGIKTSHF